LTKTEQLRKRSEEWIVILAKLQDAKAEDKDKFISQITNYLEPSLARNNIAETYFQSWSDSRALQLSSSIADVSLDMGEHFGSVRTVEEWFDSKGERVTVTQQTEWVMIDGEWFRTIMPSRKIRIR